MSTGSSPRNLLAPLVLVGAAALACGPVLLGRGYVLVGDMTFVPSQPAKDAWLGLDGSVPRAVPADAVVSFASRLVPGDLLQKAILLAALVGAAIGMLRLVTRLVEPSSRLAPLGAAVLYLWNPWVLDRLAIGHWGLLVGYAALPWVVLCAVEVRRGTAGPAGLVLALAAAAFGSPTGGVAATLVALVVVAERARLKVLALVLGAGLIVNLPWLLPGVLGSSEVSDPAGVDAFAARSDTPFGVLGSLLTFGGIWKTSLAPGERGSWLLVALALLLTVLGVLALVRAARHRDPVSSTARRLVGLGSLGLVLALLPVTGPGSDLVRVQVEHVPGAGLLRDSQKWLLLFVLAACVGVGLALEGLAASLKARQLPVRSILGAFALAPVVLLPSLAWGLAGDLEPVSYPAEWHQVRELLAEQPADQRRLVVLPWSAYQRFAWNDNRAALDPAIRFFPGDVVTNDDLATGTGRTVTGEDRVAARVTAAISEGVLVPVLADLGIRYVLVEKTAPGDTGAIGAAGTVLHDGPELRLLDLGSGTVPPRASYAAVVIAGDLLALGLVLTSGIFATFHRIGRKPGNIG